MKHPLIIGKDEVILVTGANGFVGSRVVAALLDRGFNNIRCLVRSDNRRDQLLALAKDGAANIELVRGNLLSHAVCTEAIRGVRVVFHLAAGTEKSFAGCVLNSVVTTRNLLEAASKSNALKRFVNVSSMTVYSNRKMRRHDVMDESCEINPAPAASGEAYVYAKAKQDKVVLDYQARCGIPCVIVRPGVVFGPGKTQITGRVGIDTFGFFLHLGGRNQLPFTYVDNCADAMVLAGITDSIDGEVFNIVDDDLPTSREFLSYYKTRVRRFRSFYLPYPAFYMFCLAWEKYSVWSEGQLPPVFNRGRCATYWKGNRYTNQKLKQMTGWSPRISMSEAMRRYAGAHEPQGEKE